MTEVAIKTDQFEGPIELLLQLIQKRKLAINDVSLASITDDFLRALERLPARAHAQVANFLVVAATLVLIKSRSLLPQMELSEEEEADISSLESRLRIYEQLSAILPSLRERWQEHTIYSRPFTPRKKIRFSPDADALRPTNCADIMHDLVAGLPVLEVRPTATVKPVIHIADMVSRITEHLTRGGRGSLRELTREAHPGSPSYRATAIVGFLALLELARNYEIAVLQSEHFGDITFTHATL